MNTLAPGIYQSDVIMTTALRAALADLRLNAWKLDYCFAGLAQDSLSAAEYGQREADRAKAWFLANDIKVVVAHRLDKPQLPCISVTLASSEEETREATLGDVHYDPREPNDDEWPDLCSVFVPRGPRLIADPPPYLARQLALTFGAVLNADYGTVTIPAATLAEVDPATDMVLVGADGSQAPILELSGLNADGSQDVIVALVSGRDFSRATLRARRPSRIAHLESVSFRESVLLGVHADAEPEHCIYLHAILVFCLLHHKETLLEARGFERSQVTTPQPSDRSDAFGIEARYERFLRVSGYVRQYWPRVISPTITSASTGLRVHDGDRLGQGLDVGTQLWIGDRDAL